MKLEEVRARIMPKIENCLDAIDREKDDAEIFDLVDKLLVEIKTVLMQDDGTIN